MERWNLYDECVPLTAQRVTVHLIAQANCLAGRTKVLHQTTNFVHSLNIKQDPAPSPDVTAGRLGR